MLMLRVLMFSAGLPLLCVGAGAGQTYPSKPIRIVTSEAGGSNDFSARIVAPGLTAAFGQQVIVDNRSAIVLPEIVAKAPPDGYTLQINASNFWIGPLVRKTSYDPVRDFAPISILARAPLVLVVNPSLPVKSTKELIDFAKTKPGELNYMAGEPGSTNQLNGEMFQTMTGIKIIGVSFKSSGPGTISLIGGQVQMSFSGAAGVAPHVKSGKLRALAVTSAQPSALFPDLPTVGATVPGYEFTTIYGIWAPAKTPVAIIKRLNQEILRIINRADVKERYLNVGVEVVGSSPEEFAAEIRSSMAKLGKVIKDAGLKLD